MLQRIQSLYLLIAALLVSLLFILPLAELVDKGGLLYEFNVLGLFAKGGSEMVVQRYWPLMILSLLILFLLLYTLFQYKNRIRQIRLSSLIVFLLMSQVALIYYTVWQTDQLMSVTHVMKLSFTFPLIASILLFLAIRGIKKDENLVKSIDRIR
ncbi:MAG: DUF4293 domain-containing protein [Marinilabiliales bacterium]|nr:DUF4293 domain-containing protein [Marinilabiliales bacterium]